jgi:hypothetical protein
MQFENVELKQKKVILSGILKIMQLKDNVKYIYVSGITKLVHDAPPSSLMDSNMSSNGKQRKNKESGHTPWLATFLGVKRRDGALGWD